MQSRQESLRGASDWSDAAEYSAVPTMLLHGSSDVNCGDPGRILFASGSACRLMETEGSIFGLLDPESARALADYLALPEREPLELAVALVGDGRGATTGHGSAGWRGHLHLRPLPSGCVLAQWVADDGWHAVDHVLDEQQRFRSALLELSELAHTTEDDNDFYQRLIERAVEVVPGAQAGSVQLNVAGTGQFRFVAALGFDLAGLQRHLLEPDNFFRDAWDPKARIVRDFDASRSPEISEWLETVGRLSEIVVNVSAPVLSDGLPVAFLSLDNFEDPDAMTETSVEMTTVLARLIGDLWRRRELEAALRNEREGYRHLAMHDALTGLVNRRDLKRSMDTMLDRTHRRGRPSAVLFVDIDDFKGVNDRLGHEMGDSLLVAVARGLEESVRGGDIVGRWGGDEFLVLPHRAEEAAEATALADRILAHFEEPLELADGCVHRARLTVGVGWTPDSQVDSDMLVRAADEALYEAKAAGKGTVRLRKAEPTL